MIAGFDRLLCKEIEAPKKTEGGIVLPDTAHQNIRQARVLTSGFETEDGPKIELFEGTIVWFHGFDATEITHKGEKYLIVPANCVLASAEPDE